MAFNYTLSLSLSPVICVFFLHIRNSSQQWGDLSVSSRLCVRNCMAERERERERERGREGERERAVIPSLLHNWELYELFYYAIHTYCVDSKIISEKITVYINF